ncbi:MAG: hypothetical protein WCP34_12890 [Pseudomonadota bacterium]
MIPEAMARFPGYETVSDEGLLGILSGRFRVGAFLPSWPPCEAIALPAGDWMPYEILQKSPDHKGRIFVTGEFSSGETFQTPSFLISGFWWLTLADVANALTQNSQTVSVNSMRSHDPAKDRNQLPGAFPVGKYVVRPLEPPEVSVLNLWIYESGEDEYDDASQEQQTIRSVTKDPRLEIIAREWAAIYAKTKNSSMTDVARIIEDKNIPELKGMGHENIRKKMALSECQKPEGWVKDDSRKGNNR